jgi:hypothetical protein
VAARNPPGSLPPTSAVRRHGRAVAVVRRDAHRGRRLRHHSYRSPMRPVCVNHSSARSARTDVSKVVPQSTSLSWSGSSVVRPPSGCSRQRSASLQESVVESSLCADCCRS